MYSRSYQHKYIGGGPPRPPPLWLSGLRKAFCPLVCWSVPLLLKLLKIAENSQKWPNRCFVSRYQASCVCCNLTQSVTKGQTHWEANPLFRFNIHIWNHIESKLPIRCVHLPIPNNFQLFSAIFGSFNKSRIDGQMDRNMDGWMNRQMSRFTDGWKDKWTDRLTDTSSNRDASKYGGKTDLLFICTERKWKCRRRHFPVEARIRPAGRVPPPLRFGRYRILPTP